MPKAYSLDLRERVVGFVEDGHSRRAAAAHFKVSVSFVVKLVRAVRSRGSFEPKPSGGRRHAKLEPHRSFLLAQVAEKADITMPELAAELAAALARRLIPLRCRVGSFAPAIASKKILRASEHDRPDVKQAREEWTGVRQPNMRLEPHRLVFCGRDRNHHQDDAPARPLPERPKASLQGPVRTLEDADLRRWLALRRAHRAFRH
jgi:hypothetical protein